MTFNPKDKYNIFSKEHITFLLEDIEDDEAEEDDDDNIQFPRISEGTVNFLEGSLEDVFS